MSDKITLKIHNTHKGGGEFYYYYCDVFDPEKMGKEIENDLQEKKRKHDAIQYFGWRSFMSRRMRIVQIDKQQKVIPGGIRGWVNPLLKVIWSRS